MNASLHDVLHDPGNGIAQQAVIPLDPSRVVLIARGILTALASGVVHGYINPHTILLTDEGTAVLVGDRVTPGATPPNDVFALGMALFEAVEGYAPHPAEPLPAMTRAGVLAPLIEAMTRQEVAERPDAAAALAMLRAALAAPAAASPDVTETRTLPPVPDAAASAETSVLPRIQAGPAVPPGLPGPPGPVGPSLPSRPPEPPDYSAAGYAAYEDYPDARRRAILIGGAFAAVVIIAGVALGVTRPWHRTDTSSSTVPGVPTATSAPTTPVAATPSTTASSTADTPTPTPTPTVSNPTTLVSMSLCLDAASDGGGVKSGAKVSAGTCHGSPNQAWQIHTDGTIHSMADPNLCLDAAAPNGKVTNAAQVSAWTCHGGPNQAWAWNANGTVSPAANTALCLDASGPVPIHSGANVTAWPCNGGPNEMWAKQ
jgi:hypothetical protein